MCYKSYRFLAGSNGKTWVTPSPLTDRLAKNDPTKRCFMRPVFRTVLVIALAACHATVLSAGPALHGLLGVDHGRVGAASPDHERSGEHHRGVPTDTVDDCVACHLLSLIQFNPRPSLALASPQIDRAPLAPSLSTRPTDARGHYASRAPPSAFDISRAA